MAPTQVCSALRPGRWAMEPSSPRLGSTRQPSQTTNSPTPKIFPAPTQADALSSSFLQRTNGASDQTLPSSWWSTSSTKPAVSSIRPPHFSKSYLSLLAWLENETTTGWSGSIWAQLVDLEVVFVGQVWVTNEV